MSTYRLTLSLFGKELKNIFKYPFTYVFMLLLAIIIWDTSTQVFQKFYATQEAYEKEFLGYIPYQEFQSMSEQAFLKRYARQRINKGEAVARIYEDRMSNEERGRLFSAEDKTNSNFGELYETYCRRHKIIDYGFMNYEQIKALSKEAYEKISHSLYVPMHSKKNFYFGDSNERLRYYPTYEQAKALMKLENLSSAIAREYYFRIMQVLAIIGTILIIGYWTRDYKNNVIKNIKASNIRSYQYIISKYLALTAVMLSTYFVLTMFSVFIFKPQYHHLAWAFEEADFIKYFILLPFVTQCYLNALAMLVSIISKEIIFSTGFMFYYIFLFGQSTKFENEPSQWLIKSWKYFPRCGTKLGIMATEGTTMIVHQIGYFIITICILWLTVYIWQRNRTERSG